MKTVDVSGMGGGYEHTCQMMISTGMKYFKEHGLLTVEELKGDGERNKALEKCMIDASGNDCTGAMFYTARQHAYMRTSKGDEWYFDQFKDEPHRIYEWDGTIESVPTTELSREMDQREINI